MLSRGKPRKGIGVYRVRINMSIDNKQTAKPTSPPLREQAEGATVDKIGVPKDAGGHKARTLHNSRFVGDHLVFPHSCP
jgi:hypothetical protein